MHQNVTLLICIAAALLVWAVPARMLQGKALLWFDAVGIAAYATYGAAKGLAYGVAPVPAIGMGVLTACLGGIIRDVLAGEPSILMRSELYVTAAALSSALAVALLLIGLPDFAAGAVAAAAGFVLRGGAIARGWSLPAPADGGQSPERTSARWSDSAVFMPSRKRCTRARSASLNSAITRSVRLPSGPKNSRARAMPGWP